MKAKRTIYHFGGGEVLSVDKIDVENVTLIGGPHDGREVIMVNVLDNELVMPGDVTCVYKRISPTQFTFRYRGALTA